MLEDSLTPRYQALTQSNLFQSKIVRLSDLCRFVLTCAEWLVLSRAVGAASRREASRSSVVEVANASASRREVEVSRNPKFKIQNRLTLEND
ncbi:hypothetical protein [Nostoc sp. CCY 9925]|uniref:hypothetical protein n=1 Tax=Nostoc sp. CCY 9925 TaxID=3103865 RepID=UPI0039C75DF1